MAIEDIGMDDSGYSSYESQELAFNISKQRYDRMMKDKANDNQLKDIYQAAMTYVSSMDYNTKVRLIKQYGSGGDLPKKGSLQENKLNEILVRAMINRLPKSELRKIIGIVNVTTNKMMSELNGAYRKSTSGSFNLTNFSKHTNNVAESRGNMSNFQKTLRKSGSDFELGRRALDENHGFKQLFNEIDALLRDNPTSVSASGAKPLEEIALECGIEFQEDTKSSDLRKMIASKCCLYAAIITGKNKGKAAPGFGGTVAETIRRIIGKTSFCMLVGIEPLTPEQIKLHARGILKTGQSPSTHRVEDEIKRIINVKVKDKDLRTAGSTSKLFGGNRFTRSIKFLVNFRKRKANMRFAKNDFKKSDKAVTQLINAIGELPNKDQTFATYLTLSFDGAVAHGKKILAASSNDINSAFNNRYNGNYVDVAYILNNAEKASVSTNIIKAIESAIDNITEEMVINTEDDDLKQLYSTACGTRDKNIKSYTQDQCIAAMQISLNNSGDTNASENYNVLNVLSENDNVVDWKNKILILAAGNNGTSVYYNRFIDTFKSLLASKIANAGMPGLEGDKAYSATLKRLIMAYTELVLKSFAINRASDPTSFGNKMRKKGLSFLGIFSRKKAGQAKTFDNTLAAAGSMVGANQAFDVNGITNSYDANDAFTDDRANAIKKASANVNGGFGIKFAQTAKEMSDYTKTIDAVMPTFNVTGLNSETLNDVTAILTGNSETEPMYALPVYVAGMAPGLGFGKQNTNVGNLDDVSTEKYTNKMMSLFSPNAAKNRMDSINENEIQSLMVKIKNNPTQYEIDESVDLNNPAELRSEAIDYISRKGYTALPKDDIDEYNLLKNTQNVINTNTFKKTSNSDRFSADALNTKFKSKEYISSDGKLRHNLNDKDYWSPYATSFWTGDSVLSNIQPVFVANSYDLSFAAMKDSLESIDNSNSSIYNWLSTTLPIMFTTLQMGGLAVNAAAAGGTTATVLGTAEKVAGMAAGAISGKLATGGSIHAPKATRFISGDSLNYKPNPELVSVDWANKSVSVKPIQTTSGSIPRYATGAINSNGETMSRMTLDERNSALEVSIATGLVKYSNALNGVQDDNTNTALKVYQVNSVLTEKVTVGDSEITLMDMLYGINSNIAIAANELSNHTQLLTSIAANTAAIGGLSGSTSGGESFSYPTDLDSILQGK